MDPVEVPGWGEQGFTHYRNLALRKYLESSYQGNSPASEASKRQSSASMWAGCLLQVEREV